MAEAGGTNVLEELGYDHMLASFEAVLRGASLVVANLETPVTDLGSSPLRGRKRYIHHADVEETPRHLAVTASTWSRSPTTTPWITGQPASRTPPHP